MEGRGEKNNAKLFGLGQARTKEIKQKDHVSHIYGKTIDCGLQWERGEGKKSTMSSQSERNGHMEMARSSFGEHQGERDPCSAVSNNRQCQAKLQGCINARAPDETAANPTIEPAPLDLGGLSQQQQQLLQNAQPSGALPRLTTPPNTLSSTPTTPRTTSPSCRSTHLTRRCTSSP